MADYKKTIHQYTRSKDYVATYESINSAARAMGCNESTIRSAINRPTPACNFLWKDKLMTKGDVVPDGPSTINLKPSIPSAMYGRNSNISRYDNETVNEPVENISNILIVGDLHEPFCKSGYMEFCFHTYKKYDCNRVIFIGDIIDQHFSSFWESNPDGHSAGEELRLAKTKIKKWHELFPNSDVCLGNHDIISNRKSFNSGISSAWIKTIGEVLETPKWNYEEEFIIHNVLYTHGTGRKARNRMRNDLISVVQGHFHSESYIEYAVGKNRKTFAMQVGCGIDKDSYAMAYGKHFNKPHINCGVVLNNGELPILEYLKM